MNIKDIIINIDNNIIESDLLDNFEEIYIYNKFFSIDELLNDIFNILINRNYKKEFNLNDWNNIMNINADTTLYEKEQIYKIFNRINISNNGLLSYTEFNQYCRYGKKHDIIDLFNSVNVIDYYPDKYKDNIDSNLPIGYQANLSINEVGQIYYTTIVPIAGFQFTIDNSIIKSYYGGILSSTSFIININHNLILGFSFTGESIPAGSGNFINLVLDSIPSGISDIVLSGKNGLSIKTYVSSESNSELESNKESLSYIESDENNNSESKFEPEPEPESEPEPEPESEPEFEPEPGPEPGPGPGLEPEPEPEPELEPEPEPIKKFSELDSESFSEKTEEPESLIEPMHHEYYSDSSDLDSDNNNGNNIFVRIYLFLSKLLYF